MLPPGDGDGAADPPSIKLVRQLKTPTAQHLVTDPAEMAEVLPDAMQSVEDAVASGDFASANELMDEALATVLAGPGHDRRPMTHGIVPLVLWMFCGMLLLLFVIACFGD